MCSLDNRDEELDDRLLLIRILLQRGVASQAREALAQARALAQGCENLERKLRTELIAAAVDAATGERERAAISLADVEQRASGAGMMELQLEARLARAALAWDEGWLDASDAFTLIQDAEAGGFHGLAEKTRGLTSSREISRFP